MRVSEGLQNVVLDEPDDIRADDRARGDVPPAFLVRLDGPCRFRLP